MGGCMSGRVPTARHSKEMAAEEYDPHADIPHSRSASPPPSYKRNTQQNKNSSLDIEKHSHWQIDVESKESISLDDTRTIRAIKVCGL